MNASFRHSRYILASAALLTLGAGCARESRQAQTPSETFESRAPEGSTADQGSAAQAPGAAHQHGMGHMHGERGATPDERGLQGQQGLGSQQGGLGNQQGAGQATGQGAGQATGQGTGQTTGSTSGFGRTTPGAQANAAADMMSEQELCTQLLQGSALRVENIDRGARIVVTPKNKSDLATVRESVTRIEAKFHPTAHATPRGDEASRCALFDVVETGARATIQEGPNQVSLLLVAADNDDVAELRRQVRAFSGSAGKARPDSGQKQQGSQKQQGEKYHDENLPPDGDQRRLP